MTSGEPHLFHVCLKIYAWHPVFMIAAALVCVLEALDIMPVVYLKVGPALIERDRLPECMNRVIGHHKRQVVRDHADRAYGVPVK